GGGSWANGWSTPIPSSLTQASNPASSRAGMTVSSAFGSSAAAARAVTAGSARSTANLASRTTNSSVAGPAAAAAPVLLPSASSASACAALSAAAAGLAPASSWVSSVTARSRRQVLTCSSTRLSRPRALYWPACANASGLIGQVGYGGSNPARA